MLGFVPSQQAETMEDDVLPLERYLEEALQEHVPGIRVESFVAVKYVGLVAAMKAGRVDVGFLAPFSYLLSHRDTAREGEPTRPLLQTVRFGRTHYRSQILARAGSGIRGLEDLAGRTFAFTDPASTSGFLYPRLTLEAAGIDYRRDLANYAMLGSHDNVVQALYRGTFDAGATFEDARNRLVAEFRDAAPGMRLLATVVPAGHAQASGEDLRRLEGGDLAADWCPGAAAEPLVGEFDFWPIEMRFKPPELEALAASVRPLADRLTEGAATRVPSECGTLFVQVLERWPAKVERIAVTAPIPNDIVAARPGLDPVLAAAVTAVLVEMETASPETFQILRDLYTIEGFVEATHEDFAELEALAAEAGML